jgi:uncharacterized protein (DUF2147 family)
MKILLSFLLLSFVFTSSVQAMVPEGLWLTENERSVIQLTPCGDELCGHIAWIIEGGMQVDSKNPDESKRQTPMCGLQIVSGLKKKSDTKWEGGKIYKADDGDTYNASLTMMEDDKLKVRGYIGVPMLGKSQIWTRVSPEGYPTCLTF